MEFDQIVVVDLLSSVVDSMRKTGTVSSFDEVQPGKYTITSEHNFKVDESVKINDIDYLIEEVTDDTFTFTGDEGIDFSNASWKALAPYFMHGHPIEISNRLNRKNKGVYQYRKYPLIAVFQDFEERISDELGVYGNAMPTVAIMNITDSNLYTEDRYILNFKPVLYPLYYQFLREIVDSGYFVLRSPKKIPHTKIDRVFWGTRLERTGDNQIQGGKEAHHDDYIDAIELYNMNLPIDETRCKF